MILSLEVLRNKDWISRPNLVWYYDKLWSIMGWNLTGLNVKYEGKLGIK
jgi:hypothetical protein